MISTMLLGLIAVAAVAVAFAALYVAWMVRHLRRVAIREEVLARAREMTMNLRAANRLAEAMEALIEHDGTIIEGGTGLAGSRGEETVMFRYLVSYCVPHILEPLMLEVVARDELMAEATATLMIHAAGAITAPYTVARVLTVTAAPRKESAHG